MNINLNSGMLGGMGVRRQKFGIGSLIFMLLFGLVFIAVGPLFIMMDTPDPSWSKVTGKVVRSTSNTSDGSTTYSPVVEYVVDGKKYEVASSISSSSYPTIGEQREVAYSPSYPDNSKLIETFATTWWIYLFLAIGVVVVLIAITSFAKSMKRNNMINGLMQTGQKLQGVLVDVETTSSSSSSSGSGSYRIMVAATDNSGTVRNFVSDSLTGIGGLAMADFRNTPIPIDVFIDPTNPENYYVDVADIPNLTPQRITELLGSVLNKSQPSDGSTPKPPVPPTPPVPPIA